MRRSAAPLLAVVIAAAPPDGGENATGRHGALGPNCNTLLTCRACTTNATFTGEACRWCTVYDDNACHAEGSIYNKCDDDHPSITDPFLCPDMPPVEPHLPVTPSDQVKSLYRLYAAYASYCPQAAIQQWSCKPWCTNLTAGSTVYTVAYDPSLDIQGYVAALGGTGDEAAVIIVSFRGTVRGSISNWLQDVKFSPTPLRAEDGWLGVPPGVDVHVGFLQSYYRIRGQMLSAVFAALSDCPACAVSVVGHSLGGALAHLAVADIALNATLSPSAVDSWTYGCPRVGNANFALWWDALVGGTENSHRHVHASDAVPHAPLHNMAEGFHHVPRETWELANGSFVRCDATGEDPGCSFSVQPYDYSIADHGRYMSIDNVECT